MYPGNLLERVRSWCEHVFWTKEYTLSYYEIYLRGCVLDRHKLQQSQIATIQESLPSQFVICRNLWSRPKCGILIPIILKTCSGYLGEYPGSLLTWIWKVVFLPILVFFHWFICLCVCTSVMKLIIVVPRKPSWKGPILMWLCFLNLGVYPRLLLISIWEVVFRTVTNCNSHNLWQIRYPCRRTFWFVAICDQERAVANSVQ